MSCNSLIMRLGRFSQGCQVPARLIVAALCFAGVVVLLPQVVSVAVAQTPVTQAATTDVQETPVFDLSGEHVNLVRVAGDRITDVVFDTAALEVQPDKTRGVVFVRVKNAWLQSRGQSGDKQPTTAAFFSTATASYGVTFVVRAVPSQTVQIQPQAGALDNKAMRLDLSGESEPLSKLASSDYVNELKRIVRMAATGEVTANIPAVGRAFAPQADVLLRELAVPDTEFHWKRFRIRQKTAFLTADKLCEVLVFTNFHVTGAQIDAAEIARVVPGVLAVGVTEDRLEPGRQAEVYVIRARREAAAAQGSVSGETEAEPIQSVLLTAALLQADEVQEVK